MKRGFWSVTSLLLPLVLLAGCEGGEEEAEGTPPVAIAMPVITGIAPVGPANNNAPVISGTSVANASIKIFSNSICTVPVASGSVAANGTFSITLPVADNTSNTFYAATQLVGVGFSKCSTTSATYVEDSVATVPVVSTTTPASPNSSTSPVVNGTAEANAAVRLYSNAACSTLLASTTANSSGAFSIAVTTLSNVETQIYAQSTDAIGNVSSCSSTPLRYLQDSLAPMVPTFASLVPAGPSTVSSPVLSGTAESNTQVRIYSDAGCSALLTTLTAASGGAFSGAVAISENTTTTLYARGVDAAGNLSACSSGLVTYVEDSVAPAAPTVASVTPTGPANNNAPVIAGTTEANASIALFKNAACTTALASGTANGIGNFSISVSVTDDATTTVYAKSTDVAGNVSVCSSSFVSYVEKSTVAKPVILSAAPAGPANNNSPSISGTAENNASITLYNGAACSSSIGSGTANGSGGFTIAISVSDNSSTSVYAKATDTLGNISACSTTFATYAEDSAAPTAPLLTMTSPSGPANNNSPTVQGSAEAGSTIQLYSNVGCTVTLASGSASGGGTFNIPIAVTDNTTTAIRAKATDAAGNVSACSSSLTFIEDSVAPAMPTVTSVAPVGPANNNSPTIAGTAEAFSSVTVYSNSSCATAVGSGSANGSGNYLVTATVANDSSTSFYAKASDTANNASACSTTFATYVEDSTSVMPTVASVLPLGPADNNSPAVSGTAEANASVTLYGNSTCTTSVGTGTVNGSGNFTINAAVADFTTTAIYAKATDPVGNVSVCSTSFVSYVEDSGTPVPTFTTVTPTGPANHNSPVIAGTAEIAATVRLYSDAGCSAQLAQGVVNGSGVFSIPLTVSDNTTTNVYAKATDTSANVSACSTAFVTFVEDSAIAAPTVSITSPASPANNNAPNVTGTAEAGSAVTLYSNAGCTTSLASGTATGGGAYLIAISVVDDTSTTIYAKAVDVAGNISTCAAAPYTYLEDSTAIMPAVTGVTPTGPANNNAPVIAGIAEKFSAVTLYSNAACTTSVGAGTAVSGGTFSISASILDNTTTSFYAKLTDPSGNVSACSTTFATYIEDSASTTPTVTGSAPTGPANNNAPIISGTSEANGAVTLYSNIICTTSLGTGSANASGNFAIAIAVANDTSTTVYAKAVDAVGNVSLCSPTSVTYIEDSGNVTPVISGILPIGPIDNNAPVVSGTAEANSVVTLYANAGCTTALTNGTANSGGTFSITLNVANDSSTTVYAKSVDTTGNVSACSSTTVTYVEDSTAPAKPVVTGTTPSLRSRVQNVAINGTAEANAVVKVFSDAACTAQVAVVSASGAGTFAGFYTTPKDVSKTYYANATDAAGNISACSTTSATYLSYSIASGMAYLTGTETTDTVTPTNLNQATAFPIKWSNSEYDETYFAHSTATNSHQLTAKVAGHYLVSLTLPVSSSTTANLSVKTEVRVAGVTDTAGVGASAYMANTSSNDEGSGNMTVLLRNLTANQIIDVTVMQNGAAGTVNVTNQATLTVEFIAGTRTIFNATGTQTTNSTNFNQATAYPIPWTQRIVGTGFAHNNASNPQNITIAAIGTYLVHFSLPITGAVTNGNVKATFLLGAAAQPGAFAMNGYIANSNGHGQSSIHFSGLIRTTAANQVLTVPVILEGGTGTITVTPGKTAGLYIEKLAVNDNLYYGYGTALVSGTNFNSTASAARFVTAPLVDTSIYSHSTTLAVSHSISLDAFGDYLVTVNAGTTTTVQRANVELRVALDGVPVTGAETKSFFTRNLTTNNEGSGTLTILLQRVPAWKILTITSETEGNTGTVTSPNTSVVIMRKPY